MTYTLKEYCAVRGEVMRHRLYFLMPDTGSCHRTLNDILLARIEHRHVHFLTDGMPLSQDLREANAFQKTDLVHGSKTGMLVGGICGFLFGYGLIIFDNVQPQVMVIFIATIGGLVFGGWAASMAAAAMPNSCLKAFYPKLKDGKILMILDIPALRVGEIKQLLIERHPEMQFGGEEPTIPIFP